MKADLFLRFSRPGRLFPSEEDIMVSIFNPTQLDVEIILIGADQNGQPLRRKVNWVSNPTIIKTKGWPLGAFQIVARTKSLNPTIRSNTISGVLLPDTEETSIRVVEDRIAQHRMDCAMTQTSKSVLTVQDPWILPGAAASLSARAWFPCAVYEGATSLYNECASYYEDPLGYFLTQIKALRDQGLNFITWHDVMEAPDDDYSNAVLLQFDIDAGPKSFHVIADKLIAMDIRATAMIHWQARHWYSYDFSYEDSQKFKFLEANSWAIGYHHNTLTTLVGTDEQLLSDPNLLVKAQEMMRQEIKDLRAHLDIRTLTHHGGNVMNRSVPVPNDIDIVPVDRPDSEHLWKQVSDTFSDGGFTSRPVPLSDWVARQERNIGIRFMRCHPVKYGNYNSKLDVPPLTQTPVEIPELSEVRTKINARNDLTPLERQVAWLSLRSASRSGTALAELDFSKPLSRKFVRTTETAAKVEAFRARRRSSFLRQYPWVDGDPRVIWWYMLSSFCPAGRLLNVGAMPTDQKDETYAFVPSGCQILEMDIDRGREPDILGDFCARDYVALEQFDAVLLNGLPYFSDPKRAIENAFSSLRSKGVLLVGAAGATHPERGGLYCPDTRPIWRAGQTSSPGESLSLLTTLWSFDRRSVEQLMDGWDGHYEAEAMAHYWFVFAVKSPEIPQQ